MRKRPVVLFLMVGLLVLSMGTAAMAFNMGIGGTLGYVNLRMGDVRGWLELYSEWYNSHSFISSTLGNFKSAIPYGVDTKFSVTQNFKLALGYTRLSGSQNLQVTNNRPGIEEQNENIQTSSHVVTGSLILGMPVGPLFLYTGGGIGYYLSDFTWVNKIVETSTTIEEGKGSAIGFHGLLGAEYFLGNNFSISIEGLYRIANISSAECTVSENGWDEVGDPITRPVDFSGSEESKNLELDFGGISIFGGIHIYIG